MNIFKYLRNLTLFQIFITISTGVGITLAHYAGVIYPIPSEMMHLAGSMLYQYISFDIVIFSAIAAVTIRIAMIGKWFQEEGNKVRFERFKEIHKTDFPFKSILRALPLINYITPILVVLLILYFYIEHSNWQIVVSVIATPLLIIYTSFENKAFRIKGDPENKKRACEYFTLKGVASDPAHYLKLALSIAIATSATLGYARGSHLLNRDPVEILVDGKMQSEVVFEKNSTFTIFYRDGHLYALDEGGTMTSKIKRKDWLIFNWFLY